MQGLLVLLFLVSFVLGIFLIAKPEAALELQRRFYEKINWRLIPISLAKEIRNTRIMGWLLLIFAFLVISYLVMCGF